MEKEKSKIQILDIQTEQVLFECDILDSEKAYQTAASMEEMGLSIKVVIPHLSQTLSRSLGLSRDEILEYERSLEDEMENHDGYCCFKTDKEKKSH